MVILVEGADGVGEFGCAQAVDVAEVVLAADMFSEFGCPPS